MIIAIDGPSASGKSTLARLLGQALGYQVIESGRYYRFAAWVFSKRNLPAMSPERIAESLAEEPICWSGLEDPELSETLRGDEISSLVPTVAAVPEVREIVNRALRSAGRAAPSVMEGRDIGTEVFPDAYLKIYMDVPPDVRASRRKTEGSNESIATRDHADSTRAIAPLRAAEDAYILRVSDQSPEALVSIICEKIARMN